MVRFPIRMLIPIGLMTMPAYAHACDSETMKKTESGFIFKVIGGSDKIEVKKKPDGKDTSFVMELLAPYFVICEDSKFYKVTDLQADTVKQAESGRVGYVLKEQVHPWPTREALSFNKVAFAGERPEIIAWDDETVLRKFMETGNPKLAPPAFRENLDSTLKRERSTRPYPVLAGKTGRLRNSVDKRYFQVLLPAALPPEAMVRVDPQGSKEAAVEKLTSALTSATFAVAFDATGSMEKFAATAAEDIRTAFESLPAEIQKSSRIGFVFYRDETDPEKIVYIAPQSVKDATKILSDAAKSSYMKGGGDPAEPVLDAVYAAHHLFPWNEGGQGRRIIFAVLNDDAKPATTGKIDDRVPPGLEPAQIAADLMADSIPVISVQAGPVAGPNLVGVLTKLGDGTGGTFIAWGRSGDDDDRRKNVTAALTRQLTEKARIARDEGKATLAKLEFDYRGYPSIPLAVLDGEKLGRLRSAGIKFNVDPGRGGVLIREGYMLENPDLLDPQIQIDKKTLEGLVNLFSVLGTMGVDTKTMQESASRAIAAIAGESYNKDESLETLIRKQLGIQFRTKILDFNIEYFAGMVPSERNVLAKRIQDAGKVLGQFFEANTEALDKNPAVWMPVSQLP